MATFKCAKCGQTMTAQYVEAGLVKDCPKCSSKIQVPSLSELKRSETPLPRKTPTLSNVFYFAMVSSLGAIIIPMFGAVPLISFHFYGIYLPETSFDLRTPFVIAIGTGLLIVIYTTAFCPIRMQFSDRLKIVYLLRPPVVAEYEEVDGVKIEFGPDSDGRDTPPISWAFALLSPSISIPRFGPDTIVKFRFRNGSKIVLHVFQEHVTVPLDLLLTSVPAERVQITYNA